MAARRGLTNEERLAVHSAIASATETVQSGPLFLYSVMVSLQNTEATGDVALADGTSSAALTFGTTADDFFRVRLVASASGPSHMVRQFTPPLFVKRDVVASATGVVVSLTYLPVS